MRAELRRQHGDAPATRSTGANDVRWDVVSRAEVAVRVRRAHAVTAYLERSHARRLDLDAPAALPRKPTSHARVPSVRRPQPAPAPRNSDAIAATRKRAGHREPALLDATARSRSSMRG